MRVLTFNSHQPYLHVLSAVLGWSFGVVAPVLPSGRKKAWDEGIRPLPANVRLYSSLRSAIQQQPWDWILAHNVHDLLDVKTIQLPKVFLVHGTLSGRIVQDGGTVDRERYVHSLARLLGAYKCQVVYISQLKREDLGIPGIVVPQTVEVGSYGGYRGDVRGILRVCNHLQERGAIAGYEQHKIVCRGLPNLVLGVNPKIPSSRLPATWDDLKEYYRSYRLYLHTSTYPYEDGYNLALLEAMATGMPVAALPHPTSPIKDGLNGIVAPSPEQLRAKALRLLDHPDEARLLGERAKETVARKFPVQVFRKGWESVARIVCGGKSAV